MSKIRGILFLIILLVGIGGILIYKAYTFEQKFKNEGYSSTKIVLYTVGATILSVALFILSGLSEKKGDYFSSYYLYKLSNGL